MPDEPARHRVDLETAADLGCAKCIDELENGIKKDNKCHDSFCPRKRSHRASAASASTSSTVDRTSAPTHSNKRKRASDGCEEEDGERSGNGKADGSTDPSVPLRIGGSIDFPLSNLRPHLICPLCSGYFRDPHTVADCLHTFCRSCLILFFRQGMRCCPTCNTRLGPDPFHTSISIQSREVIPDRTLQEVVDKIFPWMKAREEKDERIFYSRRGIKLKPEFSLEERGKNDDDEEHDGKEGSGSTGVMNDMLDLRMEPDGKSVHPHQRLPPLGNSILRTSGRLKIAGLKKYLAQKLGLTASNKSIEVLCDGDRMGDELSLTFIFRTRWFSSDQVLTLKYRLEEDEENIA